jgi:hypothetical protein
MTANTCHGCQKDRGTSTIVNGRHYCIICEPTAQYMALELARADAELTPEETRAIRAFDGEHAAGLAKVMADYHSLMGCPGLPALDESPEARRLAWCLMPEVYNGRNLS